MPLIDSFTEFARITQALLEANKVALGLQVVYFGDQARIPITPAACVEPGGKRRVLNGMPRRTEVTLACYVIVYHYNLKSPQDIREDVDDQAELIESFLHMDAQLRDTNSEMRVIDSMVTDIDSGYSTKSRNSLFRASRLTFEARSQVLLPSSTP